MFLAFEKVLFQFFCKFPSDEVEIIFWESEVKRSKVVKSKFDHRNVCGKYF